MKTVSSLLARNLDRKIEEIIKVDQADEQSVRDEISEYVATGSITDHYARLQGGRGRPRRAARRDRRVGVRVLRVG